MTPKRIPSFAPNTAHQQRGVVLVASLLLLLIVTMLGVSSFRDIVLQEKMSSNFRMKTLTFETANSAIQDQWPALMVVEGTEEVTEVRTRDLDDVYDQDWTGDGTINLDLDVEARLCYRGIESAPGTDTEFSAYLFEITTEASDPNGAISGIRQGGYIIAESTDSVLAISCT